jgi:Ion channel
MKELVYFVKSFYYYCKIARGVISALLIVIIILGMVFSYLQQVSMSDGLYFIFVTALSIGFGDIAPVSYATKLISVVAGFVGMIFFGLIVAIATLSLKTAIREMDKKSTRGR